jgi:hypothetical protein
MVVNLSSPFKYCPDCGKLVAQYSHIMSYADDGRLELQCSNCARVLDVQREENPDEPPLGAMPRWLWLDQRRTDIAEAHQRLLNKPGVLTKEHRNRTYEWQEEIQIINWELHRAYGKSPKAEKEEPDEQRAL